MCLLIATPQIVFLMLFATMSCLGDTWRQQNSQISHFKYYLCAHAVRRLMNDCRHEQTQFLTWFQYSCRRLSFFLTVVTRGYARQVPQQKNTQEDHKITQRRTSSQNCERFVPEFNDSSYSSEPRSAVFLEWSLNHSLFCRKGTFVMVKQALGLLSENSTRVLQRPTSGPRDIWPQRSPHTHTPLVCSLC